MDELQNMLANIPESTANLQLPDPVLKEYYEDQAKRVYWLDTEVDDRLYDFVKLIVRCNIEDKGKPVEDRKPIILYILSPGGETGAMWSCMNAMQTSKTPVYTINAGYAFSAAAEILIAGQKRFALKGSTTMFHRGSCAISGEQSVVESAQKFMNKQEKKYEDFLLCHSNINPKMYKKKASSDIYFDEEEALANGVVDKVIDDFDDVVM